MKTETKSADKASAQGTKDNKKKKGSPAGVIISVFLFALLLAVDLVGKYYAVKYLTVGESVTVIEGVFYLTLTYNRGMAFGFLNDTLAGMIVVTIITVVLMAAIVIAYVKTGLSRPGLKIILSVIEAGAIGNLVDRILMFTGNLEGVRDFLDISSVQLFSFINGGFNFGICNPADFCVSLGCVAIIIYMIYYLATDSEKKEDKVAVAAEHDEIFKDEYVEKDIAALEEIPVESEESAPSDIPSADEESVSPVIPSESEESPKLEESADTEESPKSEEPADTEESPKSEEPADTEESTPSDIPSADEESTPSVIPSESEESPKTEESSKSEEPAAKEENKEPPTKKTVKGTKAANQNGSGKNNRFRKRGGKKTSR